MPHFVQATRSVFMLVEPWASLCLGSSLRPRTYSVMWVIYFYRVFEYFLFFNVVIILILFNFVRDNYRFMH